MMSDAAQGEIEQLRAELETVRKELAALSYSVSHDLRAPLRIIDGFTEALAEDYRERLDGQALEYLRQIRESAQGMERLIHALLDLSRVTTAPLRREMVNLSEIAESIADSLRHSEPGRHVEFAIRRDLVVDGDPALLRIAIDHLLRNAWKFTRQNPKATITFGEEAQDGRRVLFLRDDGAGFDPAYATRMFTPFQRFHSSAEFEGIGIGLAIVQRIVQRHGGSVRAYGNVNAGTTIYIDLG
jgi:light-regulated signal transduction histidine kinase (bacteriophytochrome)